MIFSRDQSPAKKAFIHSLIFPCFFAFLMFSVRLIEHLEEVNLYFLGVKPLKIEGIPGIFLSPFIHSSWGHFYNNVLSFIILGVTLFYFYRKISYKVFFTIYILAGTWLWFGGRDSWHVGASGLVYGMIGFLLISGIVRKHIQLIAVTLFVVFLYGNFIWGMMPLAKELPHSWEGHLWGFLAGFTAAIVFRHEGPQKPRYFEDEEDVEDDQEERKEN
ncbi:rhomboid family intramembrane serine protease [Marinilabiliaceae bacterium ANBcel2]|nr:rhomboid family intramembrane serine protease [Marinilabiliaceae bacterium ANBcel2]